MLNNSHVMYKQNRTVRTLKYSEQNTTTTRKISFQLNAQTLTNTH